MEKKTFYDKLTICFIVIIGIGLFLAHDFQQNSIQPLEFAVNYLERIMVASDSSTSLDGIFYVKANIPNFGNPVFIYPTDATDFERMQTDLDIMATNVEKISYLPPDSSAYHIGMESVGDRAWMLKENIKDAKLYLYASLSNVFFTVIWLIGTMGLVETLIRKTNSVY